MSLGVGEDSDRQHPERITPQRPDSLLFRMFRDLPLSHGQKDFKKAEDLPDLIRNQPLGIDDMVMAKFSTAVLTTDAVNNLYICGIGRGGRLGLGDENTQFRLRPVQGPFRDRKVVAIALGDYHSMAVTNKGELWTWGTNTHCQLGITIPPPTAPGEVPMVPSPRQVFGTLKREFVCGIAASSIHSVAFTTSALYCWGKNIGQLGITDADSRSLEIQSSPRRVAASLFTCGISNVTAIERATAVLLQNQTVCVFTQYGYKIVNKFSVEEPASSFAFPLPSRNIYGNQRAMQIASGGELIAVLTGAGDIFSLTVSKSADLGDARSSTTNPTKIKNALSGPQLIWASRKEAATSVAVGENGSIILATNSGACWRRVKRDALNTGYAQQELIKRKRLFKFQRVPFVTGIIKVRASTFGAWSALRKDKDVMKYQVAYRDPQLWRDIGTLCPLEGFLASRPTKGHLDTINLAPHEIKQHGPIASEILKSANLEADLAAHIAASPRNIGHFDLFLCTSLSKDILLPVHGCIVNGRSPVLREAVHSFRTSTSYKNANEMFSIEQYGTQTVITFIGTDILTLLTLMLFCYQDKVIPTWCMRRQPALAYRSRKVRQEIMKLAISLGMPCLEEAARRQAPAQNTLHEDLLSALSDYRFFDDADLALELADDKWLPAHSTFLCRRSLFFHGLFYGRSEGTWIEGRLERDHRQKIPIDLKHMTPKAFDLVLKHIYADVGPELFNDLISANIDEFAEVVLEVIGIANYLMMDRLSEIGQHTIAKFVNTRNISRLLNEIGPCHVQNFKNAGLEYICLQAEEMLENNLLDELEDDLMAELDEKVRENQAVAFPNRGSIEKDLIRKNPFLSQDVKEERAVRIKELAYLASKKDADRKISVKGRVENFDDAASNSPVAERERQKLQANRNEPFSPTLRPQQSSQDLIFEMDEDVESENALPTTKTSELGVYNTPCSQQFKGKSRGSSFSGSSPLAHRLRPISTPITNSPGGNGDRDGRASPWGTKSFQPVKLGLKDIMSEATSGSSALSSGLVEQRKKDSAAKPLPVKMSQKERKKLQQEKATEAEATATAAASSKENDKVWELVSTKSSPWKPMTGPKTNLQHILNSSPQISNSSTARAAKPAAVESLAAKMTPRRTASPDTRFPGQSRQGTSSLSLSVRPATGPSSSLTPLIPQSRNYFTKVNKGEPALSLSMTDIIGQQQREQEIIREATAKRSLQEIQEEQAFQEWWDQESRRTQEEEAHRLAWEKDREERDKTKSNGKSRKRYGGKFSRGGSARGRSHDGSGRDSSNASIIQTTSDASGTKTAIDLVDATGGSVSRGRRKRWGGKSLS